MSEVEYIQPKNLEGLNKALQERTKASVVIAGGTDLIPEIRSCHPKIDRILSLCNIKEMQGVSQMEGWIRIGAMATHDEISEHPLIQQYFRALSMACDSVGSRQIRNRGTIGGSLANANPAGDINPCICLFHGEIEVYSGKGDTKRIPATQFTQGAGETVLKDREVIMAVWLPIREGKKSCFVKLGSRHEVTIAQISMAMSWDKEGEYCRDMEAYLGAVDIKPIYLDEVNPILGNKKIEGKDKDELAGRLKERIRIIRENRKRQPKLRIWDWERVYKERAVRSVVYDAIENMEG